ncbi:MAG: DUF4837 family protein [Paludibacteraceae bacterium]|nr:DUF4837 family protein [Paludibacteraceae bacterium]
MKRLYLYIIPIILSAIIQSCKESGGMKVTASGSIYEVLVVMDNNYWEHAAGDSVKACMEADMPCLPQIEPWFKVMHVAPQLFDDALKSTRNILYIDINPQRYTQTKISYHRDVYSHPQAFCRVQCPTGEAFHEFYSAHAGQIREWFVQEEISRQTIFYRNYQTSAARNAVQHRFASDIRIPSDYQLVRDTAYTLPDGTPIKLVWCVNNGGSMRKDLLIWGYPYTEPETFTEEYLLQRRDEIVGGNLSGQIAGSFVGTEHKHIPPQFTAKTVHDRYCAEVRGLWKLYGGESMGGPFVQHTRLDELSQQVITAEVMVFAPGQKKRNALRQAEAILYTLQLPEELMIEEK